MKIRLAREEICHTPYERRNTTQNLETSQMQRSAPFIRINSSNTKPKSYRYQPKCDEGDRGPKITQYTEYSMPGKEPGIRVELNNAIGLE
jgi:hypothetical protein